MPWRLVAAHLSNALRAAALALSVLWPISQTPPAAALFWEAPWLWTSLAREAVSSRCPTGWTPVVPRIDVKEITSASAAMERSLSDRSQFMRTAWTNNAFTDITLAISVGQEGGTKSNERPATRYVDCVKFQLAKHSPIFRSASSDSMHHPLREHHHIIRLPCTNTLPRWCRCRHASSPVVCLPCRAQIERWGGVAAAAAEGRMLETSVKGEEELAALMLLLEAMHMETLPPVEHCEPGLHLCRLLCHAHFYDVRLVLEAAAGALKDHAASLPAAHCAAVLCMLQPVVEGEGGSGGGVLAGVLAACDQQLLRQLDPLDRLFEDEELGATFDALPLQAVVRAVGRKPQGAADSQETGG